MDPYEFIKDRYDMSGYDLDLLRDAMTNLPMIDFENIIDLMEAYSEHKKPKQNPDEFTIKFANWLRKEDTQENADKWFHYSDMDMLNAFKEEQS
jgi:Asp-tRNA(Asn)/Glu-tRNA(Gln) amidotransferase C subunit